MSMHPTLTTTVYIIIAVIFTLTMLYMFLYTRGLKTKEATLRETGHLPSVPEEGIAIATEEKERAGRSGTIN